MSDNHTNTARIEIDADLCGGLGECINLAPDMIELGDDGIARAIINTGDFERLEEIAFSCPLAAIAVARGVTT